MTAREKCQHERELGPVMMNGIYKSATEEEEWGPEMQLGTSDFGIIVHRDDDHSKDGNETSPETEQRRRPYETMAEL